MKKRPGLLKKPGFCFIDQLFKKSSNVFLVMR
jgi:hypothetical protein